jgi:hypothetical protein
VGGGRIRVAPSADASGGSGEGDARLVSLWLAMVGAAAVNALAAGAAFHCCVFPFVAVDG